MKLRNVSDGALTVPALGNRTVEPDDVVEVSDDLGLVWPESLWEVVLPAKPAKSTTSEKE